MKLAYGSLLTVVMLVCAPSIRSQEMEPRAYSPAPVGSQFVLLTYAHQTGDVLLDSSLPLKDVEIKLNLASAAYGVPSV